MTLPILTVRVQYEDDVVASRQRAKQVAEVLGFETQPQTRLATAVSEIARNAFAYAGGGKVEFLLEGATTPQLLTVRISDEGRGIPNLEEILEGRYRSQTGMGMGLLGARRLMDQFSVVCPPGKGTVVTLGKLLPRRSPLITAKMLPQLAGRIAAQKPRNILDELREQNQELMQTLEELRNRQQQLAALNRELDDTNRGVVALYAELDEKADHLRRADEVKTKFLSNMSHEFRTPLNSILALSRILLDRTDGDLTSEQEIQVTYIRKSAESLFELVNDLLDLAKVEAGKIVVRPVEFEVNSLFGALRGMLRPLLVSSSLNLIFEDACEIPPVYSDEGKVSQILRNFISNALKFTEAGEVRVAAEAMDDKIDGAIAFRVSDTGIGIAPEDQETIFKEFAQLDSSLQRKVKGTGLGLPLSRKLAELLGGSVRVESRVGRGSTFVLTIPKVYKAVELQDASEVKEKTEPSKLQVLLVEDHFETRLIYEKYLQGSPWQIVSARSLREAGNILRNITPAAVILDVVLQGEDTWDLLARLKSDPLTQNVPVVMATSVEDRSKAMALGADAYVVKPLTRAVLRALLWRLTGQHLSGTVLVVDDEEVSRYLVRQVFGNPRVRFLEASNGAQALELAMAEKPDLVMTDLGMPGMDGFQLVEQMSADANLKDIPVIVATSRNLSSEQVRELSKRVLAILPKESFSGSGVAGKLYGMLSVVGLQDLMGDAGMAEASNN
jgi:signal transduction histidine kinase/CheY-like chemotaxis protein